MSLASDNFYNSHINELRREIRQSTQKLKGKKRKKIEIEASYVFNDIKQYGLSFEPEHYIVPLIQKLKEISERASDLSSEN